MGLKEYSPRRATFLHNAVLTRYCDEQPERQYYERESQHLGYPSGFWPGLKRILERCLNLEPEQDLGAKH